MQDYLLLPMVNKLRNVLGHKLENKPLMLSTAYFIIYNIFLIGALTWAYDNHILNSLNIICIFKLKFLQIIPVLCEESNCVICPT